MRTIKGVAALALVAAFAAACTGGTAPSAAPTEAPTVAPTTAPTVAPTEAASAAASEAPTVAPTEAPTPDACATANLALKVPGTLTIGTDNPAYPPYFAHRSGGNTAPWEESDFTGDPTTGEGFESAMAYAIAEQLGFTKDQVTWIVVPFNNSFAPGAKEFDFDLNQVSYTPERAQAAGLSDGYYYVSQSVVAMKDSPLAKVTSIAGLADFVYGAQSGTTSFATIQDVIKPTKDPQLFDTNDLAVKALKQGQIDGLVVDVPTADFVTNVQVSKAVAVGKFDNNKTEYFSAVLEKDSALIPCVNAAIQRLWDAGTIDGLITKWLPFQDQVPVFQP